MRCETNLTSNLTVIMYHSAGSSLLPSSPTSTRTRSYEIDAATFSQYAGPVSRRLELENNSAGVSKCGGDCYRREFECKLVSAC